ncbi:hypothetical protein EWM62_07815 [Mucilaginibacter terrigena]|uniref:Uncharacterized protein n=1 Tax=Mucilaginibacter terrigena TaxID=2492395 RepID=A0A4Q5LMZ8_9SPHI|nr:hypothetical protein [Mucilaginibacter terrigena]RYU90552.1 hypothetical protein EWM62_07815 [Mucilaginibacter terrigena]
MKKYLLFIVLFIASGSLMAQSVTIAPFDKTFDQKLTQTFKLDSALRVPLPLLPTDKFFKQGDINKLTQQNQMLAQLKTGNDGYNMPVYVLSGTSNMPIKKIEGNYTMPVLRDEIKKLSKVTP